MSDKAIYLISGHNGADTALISANNISQARAHYTRNKFISRKANQQDLIRALGRGILVETAIKEKHDA